jgi:excisionase family DNA binding protein
MHPRTIPSSDAERDRLLYSIPEAAGRLGLGRSTMYRLVYENKLRTVRIGQRRLVSRSELERFVAELEDAS